MNIPKQIKIGAHTYKVAYPYHFKERGDLIHGQIDHPVCEIRVNDVDSSGNARNETQVLRALIHEIIHGVENAWGLDFDEKTVGALAEGFTAVIIDNGFVRIPNE